MAGAGRTYESQGGKAAVQALLKHKARDGWEFDVPPAELEATYYRQQPEAGQAA